MTRTFRLFLASCALYCLRAPNTNYISDRVNKSSVRAGQAVPNELSDQDKAITSSVRRPKYWSYVFYIGLYPLTLVTSFPNAAISRHQPFYLGFSNYLFQANRKEAFKNLSVPNCCTIFFGNFRGTLLTTGSHWSRV